LPLPGSSRGLGAWSVVLGAPAPGRVALGNRSGVSRWADHRSSKFGACPVVSGAPVFDPSPEGAPDSSFCWGVSCCANATPELMISAKLAKINNCFLKGFSSRLVGSRGKRPASLSGSSSGVAEETIGRRRECRGGLVVAIADRAPIYGDHRQREPGVGG
jgi:hypothetical protein